MTLRRPSKAVRIIKGVSPLRIAWASPINRRSAIGREGMGVVNKLTTRGHTVTVISTELDQNETVPSHPTTARVVHWSAVEVDSLAHEFDIVVCNIGDHYPYHAGVFPLLNAAPVLAIFHDFCLYNLFNGWLWHNTLGQAPGRHEVMRRHIVGEIYGSEIAAWTARPPMT